MCRFNKGLIAPGLALLASLGLVAGAAAHGVLFKSQPEAGAVLTQSPEQVIAWFSQELDTGFSTFQVLDGEGRQIDNGDGGVDLNDPDHALLIVTLPPALPDGLYTAQWTVTSAEDGDTTTGQISFTVGRAIARQTPAANELVTASWTSWLVGGIVLSLGVLLMIVMVFTGSFSQSSQGT